VHHLVVWFQRLASERASTRAPTASPPAAGRLRSRWHRPTPGFPGGRSTEASAGHLRRRPGEIL